MLHEQNIFALLNKTMDSGSKDYNYNDFGEYRYQPSSDQSNSYKTSNRHGPSKVGKDSGKSKKLTHDSKSSHRKVSRGAIAGIIIGSLVIIGGIIAVVVYEIKKNDDKDRAKTDKENMDRIKKAISTNMDEYNKQTKELTDLGGQPFLLSDDTKNLLKSDNMQSLEKGLQDLTAVIQSNAAEIKKKLDFTCSYSDWSQSCDINGPKVCGNRRVTGIKNSKGDMDLSGELSKYCTDTSKDCKKHCQSISCQYKTLPCEAAEGSVCKDGTKRGTKNSVPHFGVSSPCPELNDSCDVQCQPFSCQYGPWSDSCGDKSDTGCGSRQVLNKIDPSMSEEEFNKEKANCTDVSRPCSKYCCENTCVYNQLGACKPVANAPCRSDGLRKGTKRRSLKWPDCQNKQHGCNEKSIDCSLNCTPHVTHSSHPHKPNPPHVTHSSHPHKPNPPHVTHSSHPHKPSLDCSPHPPHLKPLGCPCHHKWDCDSACCNDLKCETPPSCL